MKKILIIVIILVLLLAVGIGAMFFMMSSKSSVTVESLDEEVAEEEVVQEVREPYYLEIRPPFVVTLLSETKSYFLQVETAVLAYSQEDFDALEKNQPAIKSALVDLYSVQDVNYMKTKEGKDKLKEKALQKVKDVMKKAYGKDTAEEIYFTKFVIQ